LPDLPTAGEARLAGAGMKKPKRKKDAPRKATAINAYIGDRMRERRQVLKMGQADIAKALGIQSSKLRSMKPATIGSARRGCTAFAVF
jgi:hypothetical protein